MAKQIDRREFLRLASVGGGVVFASGLAGCATGMAGGAAQDDFYFVQLSDTHWGFSGPPNPDAAGTLQKAVASVNALSTPPDFIMFTGDLTHTTDDGALRRKRLGEFKEIVSKLNVKTVRFIPGEHDASLDRGAAYREFFGNPTYSFTHKGVNFVTIDNVSDPTSSIGAEQLEWLGKHLATLDKSQKLVVFTHRPLFNLAPTWDWATRDGAKAVELLKPFPNVTVFYGHIHQEHHHMTEHIPHHAAKSLIFPLPVALSQPSRAPLPWNKEQPYSGLGWRGVQAKAGPSPVSITEYPVIKA